MIVRASIVVGLMTSSVVAVVPAAATTLDFEAPTYTAGLPVAGQDDWVVNTYPLVTGTTWDATVLGPGSGPLGGQRSLAVGSPTARVDVSRDATLVATADGSDAADVHVRYRQRTVATGGHNGVFVSNDVFGGATAVWVRIEGREVRAVDGRTWRTIGSYASGDDIEVSIDLDLDLDVYSVSVRNVSLGETDFTLLTPSPLACWDVAEPGAIGIGVSGEEGIGVFDDLAVEQLEGSASSMAGTIDFEAPTYTAGLPVAGQDDWVVNTYPVVTGTTWDATVLGPGSGPLGGQRSLAVGSPTARVDVSRDATLVATADGSDAADVHVRYRQRTVATGGHNGVFVSNDVFGGATAVWVRIEGREVRAVDGRMWRTIGSYASGDDIEVSIDLDLDLDVYSVSVRNVSLGETDFTLLTPSPLAFWDAAEPGAIGIGVSGEEGIGVFDDLAVEQLDPSASSMAGTIDFGAPTYTAGLPVAGRDG